ncbi:MAG: DUF2510 domain-containing protein [Mycobacterium sp.]|nr:DUF2510 domain-containing protein [Mycobacterium sp.]
MGSRMTEYRTATGELTESPETPPPVDAVWIGEWDTHAGDRAYRLPRVDAAAAIVFVTGLQNRDGSTYSGISMTFADSPRHTVAAEMTVAEARELARLLIAQADRAKALDAATNPPTTPGWYPQLDGGKQRYWDGRQWQSSPRSHKIERRRAAFGPMSTGVEQ